MKTFSVLIANYNNSNYFKDCYNSLLNQTISNFEVIILDDFSTLDDYEKIKKLISNDNRFKIFRNDSNKGVGYTKRKLVELSKGDICGFLDPDDTLEKNAIEKMLKAHQNNINASIINSNFNYCDNNLNFLKKTNVEQVKQRSLNFYNLYGSISHFATFKKDFYNKTAGIDPYFKIAEDQDIYLKLYEIGDSIQINDTLYNYRINPNSLTNTSKGDITFFWHWVAIIKAAERRNMNVEELFLENFVRKSTYDNEMIKNNHLRTLLRKSRWLRLGSRLGLFKLYKYL